MDLWIRSDSERTVGGIIAVVVVFLPWDITYIGDIAGGSLLYIRFPLFEFQYAMGIQAAPPVVFRLFTAAAEFHSGPLQPAFQAALVGGALSLIVGVLGLSLFATQDRSGDNPVVKVLGGFIIATGLAFLVAWYFVFTRGAAGIDIPLGGIVSLLLGAVLVVAERR